MSVSPAVPGDTLVPPCGTSPFWQITTLTPGPLYLWLQKSRPHLLTGYVKAHGLKAGKRYHITPRAFLCLPQLEPQTSLTHTWRLPTLPAGTTVWLTWADSCDPAYITTASPPVAFTYQACPVAPDWCSAEQPSGSFSQVGAAQIRIPTLVEGDIAWLDAANGWFRPLLAATYHYFATLTMRAGTVGNPWTGNVSVYNFSHNITYVAQSVVLPLNPGTITLTLSCDFTIAASNTVGLRYVPINPVADTGAVIDGYAAITLTT